MLKLPRIGISTLDTTPPLGYIKDMGGKTSHPEPTQRNHPMKALSAYLIGITAITACLIGQYPGQATTAERCDAGSLLACRKIAIETMGQCASPGGIGGCRFDSKEYE